MWRQFFDQVDGKAPKGARRSSSWRKVRKAFLADNPRCAICDGTKKLEVHHIVPFHLSPSFELEPLNLMALCERKKYGINCHLLVGHLGNYRKVNPSAKTDALWMRAKIGK